MTRPFGFLPFIRRNGFHSLMLVVAAANGYVRLACTEDPVARVWQMKRDLGEPLELRKAWWMAGKVVTRRIQRTFKSQFEWRLMDDGWFDVRPAAAEAFIDETIRSVRTWGVTEAEMAKLMEAHERRKLGTPVRTCAELAV